MSIASAFAITAGFGPLIGDSSAPFALISSPFRNLGGIFPDVVVEEVHQDNLTITQHPVEVGAPVTDHAFMQPYMVDLHAMWSDSSAQSSGYVQEVYNALLALQASAKPFSVVTGKRSYSNMLLRTLGIRTDDATEWALDCHASCQQIIITSTQTTSSSGGPSDGTQVVTNYDNSNNQPTAYSQPAGAGASGTGVPGIAPDENGFISVNNYPTNWGTTQLSPAPAGAPTVSSVTGG